LAGTASSVSTIKVYLNNTLKSSTSNSGTATSTDWSSGETRISNNWGNATTRRFNGKMDQTAIWDKVLTTDEIALLYNNYDGLAYSSW